MRLPDVIVLGARKAGTSTLYDYFLADPSVFVPDEKELAFFAVCDFSLAEIGWPSFRYTLSDYEAAFSSASPSQVTIEVSSLYLHSTRALTNLAKYGFQGKLVVITRDPVERICSEYRYLRGNLKETIPSIRAAILAAESRLHTELDRVINIEFNYIENSKYQLQIQRARDILPHSEMHIMRFESLVNDPSTELDNLYRFIGINKNAANESLPHSNKSKYPRFFYIKKLIRDARQIRLVRDSVKRLIPYETRQNLLSAIENLNTGKYSVSEADKRWIASQLGTACRQP